MKKYIISELAIVTKYRNAWTPSVKRGGEHTPKKGKGSYSRKKNSNMD